MRIDASLAELTVTVVAPADADMQKVNDILDDIGNQVELGLLAIADSLNDKFGSSKSRDKYKLTFSIETTVK